MKNLIEYIITHLVDHPEKLTITEKNKGTRTELQVRVEKADRGKVIGRQGRVINAIRTLANAAGSKDNSRVFIEMLD